MNRLGVASGPTVALLAALIALSWLISYAAGGANTVPPHFVYVPVFLAGWRLGIRGAVATALLGGIAVGPLLPADASAGLAQPTSDWAVRLVFFAGIGVFIAAILERSRGDAERALLLARREQDLAVRESLFLQSVSHEIRTPLTVIRGVVHTLEQRRMITEIAEHLTESLKRAVEQLDRLSLTALAAVEGFEQLDPRRAETIDLHRLIAALSDELAHLNAARRMKLQIPKDERRVHTHPGMLRPALSALLENALKFSPPMSPVEVRTGRSADGIQVWIRDFGNGIDPLYLRQAFQPFTQQDATMRREHGGLGIGLYASRRLIEQLGGTLMVLNVEGGRGVEAMVALPATGRTP